MNFSEKLKTFRQEHSVSQNELAIALNINQTTVSSWELGKKLPDFNNILALSKFFNVTTDYLLGADQKD